MTRYIKKTITCLSIEDVVHAMREVILSLANQVGFDEVEEADVTQLLQSHGEELTNEDLN